MTALLKDRHFINKATELLKFAISVGVFCFMLVKVPEQAATLVTYAGAFLLGGSKLKDKLGL